MKNKILVAVCLVLISATFLAGSALAETLLGVTARVWCNGCPDPQALAEDALYVAADNLAEEHCDALEAEVLNWYFVQIGTAQHVSGDEYRINGTISVECSSWD